MKSLNLVTLLLTIVGGVNWGLVGLFDFNLVAALFGADTIVTRAVYIIVGLSALYQLAPFSRALRVGEIRAERAY
jgi:uncharacterized protein